MPLFGHHHEQFHEVRDAAQEDVDALTADIEALERQLSGAPDEATTRRAEAQKAQQRAEHQLKRAKHPEQLAAISELLEVGRYQLAAATALTQRQPIPERRPPCFFDPRHGPSVTAVKWAPDGGKPRLVPVCAGCAKLIEAHSEPQVRRVRRLHDDDWMWWNLPGYYGPWASGYYQSFGGGNLINDLLAGSVLGAAIGIGGDVVGAVGDAAGAVGGAAGAGIGAVGDVVDGGLDAIGDVADGAIDAVDDVIGDLFGDGGDGDGGGGDGGGGDGGGDGGDGGDS
jgi:hypothetical protein